LYSDRAPQLPHNPHDVFRSITFIKSVHSIVFIIMATANLLIFYAAITGRITTATWISLLIMLGEGIALALNGGRCPLTVYAERQGALKGSVTDIFLPKWCADKIFPVCGSLLVLSLLILATRLLVGWAA
jgi:hypothetical protein